MSERVLEALAVVAEVTGTELSKGALQVMTRELQRHDEQRVLRALARCMREIKGRLTLADVIERLQGSDGRPGADEAWSIALAGMDESATVMLNDEIAQAMSVARPIYQDGDRIGARMAFRSAYERVVEDARTRNAPARWWPSLGSDAAGREQVIRDAVERGLLTQEVAIGYLPAPVEAGGERLLQLVNKGAEDLAEKIAAMRAAARGL